MEEKANSAVDKQLKEYYDELILLENNKEVLMPQQKPKEDNNKQSNEGKNIFFGFDLTDSFNMIIIKALLNILNDVYLEEKHILALDVLNKVLEILGTQIQKDIELILPILLILAKKNHDILSSVEIIAEKCDTHRYAPSIVAQLLQQNLQQTQNTIRLLTIVTHKYHHSLRHFIGPIVHFLHSIVEKHNHNTHVMIDISFIYQNIKAYI